MAAKFLSGWMFRRPGSTFAPLGRGMSDGSPTPRRTLRRGWRGRGPALVVMEPTGGYERALCSALAEADVRYVQLPTRTRSSLFARPAAYTSRQTGIDAMLIAHYLANAVQHGDLPATFRADERLEALAAQRRQLVDARPAESCTRSGERSDRAGKPGGCHRGADPKP